MLKKKIATELESIAFSIRDLILSYDNAFTPDEKETVVINIEDCVEKLEALIVKIK